MKILWGAKDGGAESRVWVWGFESKRFGSFLLLKFGRGSRDAFHSHAFNSWSWVLKGFLWEDVRITDKVRKYNYYEPSFHPVRTLCETYHKVYGIADTNWVLTVRGPWVDNWKEFLPPENRERTLTHGRKEVG